MTSRQSCFRVPLVAVKSLRIVSEQSAHQIRASGRTIGTDAMRSVLAMSFLIVLCASANAATVRHPHARQPAVERPSADVNSRARFAVPGWSDDATQRWLNNASSNVGRGG